MTPRRRRDEDEPDVRDHDGIDDEFERMRRIVEGMVEQMTRGEVGLEMSEPFVYGISLRAGPDGKPVIQKFGNTRAMPQAELGDRREDGEASGYAESFGEREPMTDVIEDGKTVAITVEIPGVNKEDIDLSVAGRALRIKVDSAQRRYYKEVALPAHVDPASTKATYNNGVLDIAMDKLSHGSAERKIRIE